MTDKIPGVDTAWDTVHTFIRIPAGALMAAGAVGDVGPALEVSAIILGGGLATVSHMTKAGSRVVICHKFDGVVNVRRRICDR